MNNKENFSYSNSNQKDINHDQYLKETHYIETQISLENINVLPQPRKTFEKIDELANDILEKGLISPLLIARFSKENSKKYLKAINILWKKEIKKEINLENLKINNEDGNYYILIAGERRLRAIKSLQKNDLFNKVFPQEKIDARICDNPSPLEALFRQASENIHQRPPAHEEAEFYASLFSLICEEKGKYYPTRFAKDVGKDPETIIKAIQFSLLPNFVKNAVINKYLSYGAACQLGRMVKDLNPEVNFKKEDINLMAIKAMGGQWKTDRCQKEVRKKIEESRGNQPSFEIFTEKDRKKLEKLSLKSLVAKEIVEGSWDFISYLRKINFLIKENQLKTKGSPFTEENVTKSFSLLINEQEKLLPHLKKITEEEKQRMEKILKESKKTIEEIIIYKSATQEDNLS